MKTFPSVSTDLSSHHEDAEGYYYQQDDPARCEYLRLLNKSNCDLSQNFTFLYLNPGFHKLEEEIQVLLPKMLLIARTRPIAVSVSSLGAQALAGEQAKGVWEFIELFNPHERSAKSHELRKMQQILIYLMISPIDNLNPHSKKADATLFFDQLREIVIQYCLSMEDLRQFFIQRESMITAHCDACKNQS